MEKIMKAREEKPFVASLMDGSLTLVLLLRLIAVLEPGAC